MSFKKIVFFLFLIVFLTMALYYRNEREKLIDNVKKESYLASIKSSYDGWVVFETSRPIYKLDKNQYVEVGMFTADFDLQLDLPEKIPLDTEYFKLKGTDYYIAMKALFPMKTHNDDKVIKEDTPVIKTLKTEGETAFYLNHYQFIVIKDAGEFAVLEETDRDYTVNFNGRAFIVLKSEIKEKK